MVRVLAIMLVVWPLVGCSQSVSLTVKVVEGDGAPVSNAVVKIEALKRLFVGAGSSPNDFRTIVAHSDSNGVVRVQFDLASNNFIYWTSADGFYRSPFRRGHYKLKKDHLFYVELAEREKEDVVALRRIRNPVPMFGYTVASCIDLPQDNGDYGFDMVVGDLVHPHGKGKAADFYVRKNFDAKSRSTKSELFFKGRGNGAYKCKAYMDSELRSCYEADTNATFLTRFRYEYGTPELLKNPDPNYGPTICDVWDDEYLVLRTRCQYDDDGRLVSCHYSKIYGRIEIFAWLKFRAYAFNPTPNDPNLEFDVNRNLLQKDTAPYFP